MLHNGKRHDSTKQNGFLAIGTGLILLAIYGVVGTGILITQEPASTNSEVLVSQTDSEQGLQAE